MFTVRISLSKYGQLPSSFQAVNLIFHFMINSSKLGWFYKRHHLPHCVACNTIPLKDKHSKTASRMVTLCQHECGNAIKSQLRTERSICKSFSGSCLITCTRPMSLRPGLIFCRLHFGQGNQQLNYCLLHKHPHLNMEVMGYQQLDELAWRERLLGFFRIISLHYHYF